MSLFFYPSPAVKTRPLGAEKSLADFPGLNSGACSRVFDHIAMFIFFGLCE